MSKREPRKHTNTAHIPRLPSPLSAAMRAARRAGRMLEPALLSSSELVGYLPFTAHGRTLHYRVGNAHRLEGAGSSPGVLFFFDGDYLLRSGSRLLRRTSTLREELSDIAYQHRMLLVPVLAPGTVNEGVLREATTNWWVRARANGRVFRALAADLHERYGYDRSRVWLAGYSGGAEFIAYELLLHTADAMIGGGATLIGGGGADGIPTQHRAPNISLSRLLLSWHVGDKDGRSPRLLNDTRSGGLWSAQVAAQEGGQFYARLGARTALHVMPGQGHRNYPITQLVRNDLAMATRLGYL